VPTLRPMRMRRRQCGREPAGVPVERIAPAAADPDGRPVEAGGAGEDVVPGVVARPSNASPTQTSAKTATRPGSRPPRPPSEPGRARQRAARRRAAAREHHQHGQPAERGKAARPPHHEADVVVRDVPGAKPAGDRILLRGGRDGPVGADAAARNPPPYPGSLARPVRPDGTGDARDGCAAEEPPPCRAPLRPHGATVPAGCASRGRSA